MSNLDGCNVQDDCLICQWTVESILRHTKNLLDALIADVPPITLRLWTSMRHIENRLLPMRLEDV